jgi:hypothetical protein
MKDVVKMMADLKPLLNGIDAMRDTCIDINTLDDVVWDFKGAAEERAAASRDVELAMKVLEAAHKFLQTKARNAKLLGDEGYYHRVYEDAQKYRIHLAEQLMEGVRITAPTADVADAG